MNKEVLVEVNNVSKKFSYDLRTSLKYGIIDLFYRVFRIKQNKNRLRKKEFWAVSNVSFKLHRGECMGLIGHNGAGKSTLLKMLNGLIMPDDGEIIMRGKVGALIELGAGFNPILTGRENIYNNGAVLGFSKKEIDKKLDAIIEFSEMGEFIDTPVQNYSSGMKVRLGFGVASQMEPDILLIDEVLAVGDVGFRTKCYNVIYELTKKASVIFVSHSMPQIDRLCDMAILMQRGTEKCKTRETAPVIDEYYKLFNSTTKSVVKKENVEISNISINSEEGSYWELKHGEAFNCSFKFRIPAQHKQLEISLSFLRPSLELLAQSKNNLEDIIIQNDGSTLQCEINLDNLILGSGKKTLSLAIVDFETNEILYWAYSFGEVFVTNKKFIAAPIYFSADFKVSKSS